MSHSVFLSYASPDRDVVEEFYDALVGFGLNPWMDSRKLTAGQNWDFEIQRALDQAAIVVVFLSSHSITRRGYVQREIKLALRKQEEKLIDDVFLIPVALEPTERPRELSDIQFLDASSRTVYEDLRRAVSTQLEKVGEAKGEFRVADEVAYRIRSVIDSYDGIPGYEINTDFISIESNKYKNVTDAANFINGALSDLTMSARNAASDPDPINFNLAQDSWSRTNSLDLVFNELTTVGRVCSVSYTIHTYMAGAAHPVSSFLTYNFMLSPVTRIESLGSLFDNERAIEYIQLISRQQLLSNLRDQSGTEPDISWITSGTSDWSDLDHFTFKDGNLLLHFGSYQVAAYAYGHQSVSIPLVDLAGYLTRRASIALNVGWQRDRARETSDLQQA